MDCPAGDVDTMSAPPTHLWSLLLDFVFLKDLSYALYHATSNISERLPL